MLNSLRRLQKTKFGTAIIAAFFILILIGFASADMSNVGSGKWSFGMGSSTLVEVGSVPVTEQEMSDAMQRRLQEARQQRPEAEYSTIIGDFDEILSGLIDQKTLFAFAQKFKFPLSKRLVDAEIAQIPQTKGLNGQFCDQAYRAFLAQQRLSDAEVRSVLAGGLLQRYMLTPVAANARVSVGMGTPYAAMLLESREGHAAAIPLEVFRSAFKPTDADLQRYYAANKNRYMVPEQRALRIARIGPEQVANVTATDQEVTAYYNSHKGDYASKEMRSISQAVVQDQATASAIAQRAKGGATIAAAAAPAGANAAVTTLTDQTREAYASIAGDTAAAAVFAAPSGGVVGPVQTDFGWAVAKVDSVKTTGGKTLDQARSEIQAKLTADKRSGAIEELVGGVQDAVDNGSSYSEVAAKSKLTVTTTPLLTATGAARSDPTFKLPPELAPALKAAFEIETNDPPEIVSLGDDRGYAMISPAQVVTAAPAPLAQVRDRVASDWIDSKALERARSVAAQIEARVQRGTPLAEAMKQSGAPLPPVQPLAARRIQVATAQGPVPAPIKMLFTLAEGKSRMVPDPEGRGFFIVKVDKITPGNALLQPALIGRMQNELQEAVSQEYAQEFLAAMRKEVGVERNDSAIQALKNRMTRNGG
jgi:peptidyl-prolyl cis-trans isomerase D